MRDPYWQVSLPRTRVMIDCVLPWSRPNNAEQAGNGGESESENEAKDENENEIGFGLGGGPIIDDMETLETIFIIPRNLRPPHDTSERK